MSPELLNLALTRRGAPSWIRERPAVGEAARRERLARLGAAAGEALLLHTCERLEVWAAVDEPGLAPWEAAFARWLDLDTETFRAHLEVRRGDEALRHLLRVTSGLESRLVGETQVRGQVLQAWQEAREAHRAGPIVSALARCALHTSRRVRRETRLGRGRESLVTLVLARLRRELGTLAGRQFVVAGTGALAAGLVPALRAEGAWIRVVSRSPGRAVVFSRRFGLADRTADRAGDTMPDALVACTHGVLGPDEVAIARRCRLTLDLGSPSNLPPDLGGRAGPRQFQLQDLETSASAVAVLAAERIVRDEAMRLREWLRERAAAPLVARLLRERASLARPSPEERRALHREILRLKARAAA